jgi:hypothetical protein
MKNQCSILIALWICVATATGFNIVAPLMRQQDASERALTELEAKVDAATLRIKAAREKNARDAAYLKSVEESYKVIISEPAQAK